MSKKTEPFNNAFAGLKAKATQPVARPEAPRPPPPRRPPPRRTVEEDEAALFREAIGDVEPVRAQASRVPQPTPTAAERRQPSEEAESLARLAELVSGVGDFEREEGEAGSEGAVRGFDARVLRKLKAGAFSTQARLDLHGRSREEAKAALERFIQQSRVAGHRCVLVITGRGLHSDAPLPVLKQEAPSWLTRGPAARHVLAFCQARPSDGGGGALYVLLRR